MTSRHSFQEARDDFVPGGSVEIVVFHHQVNPIKKCVVEMINKVGGQKQDSMKVFQFTEEYRHQAVPFQGKLRTPLEKHIRFIQQQDGVPSACNVEDSSKLKFELSCISAEFSSRGL